MQTENLRKRGRARFLFIKKILKIGLDFIFPKVCVGCAREGNYICQKCFLSLKKIDDCENCFWCMKEKAVQKYDRCSFCQEKVKISQLIALFDFEDRSVGRLINLFKERGVKEIGEFLGERMAEKFMREKINLRLNLEKTMVTFVPTFWKTKNIRGYNQAEVLARSFSKALNLECRELLKIRKGVKGERLKRREKITNLQKMMRVKNEEILVNKEIILIDDFMVTGATLFEAARILKEKGARRVIAGVIAKKENEKIK
jgi:ComF family protein